jgi:hypothetical protein
MFAASAMFTEHHSRTRPLVYNSLFNKEISSMARILLYLDHYRPREVEDVQAVR